MVVPLTKGFIEYLQAHTDSEVDLNAVEQALHASKRRLYDVTNVLAGAGLIERQGKALVKWIGRKPRDSVPVESARKRKEAALEAMTASVDRALADLMSSERFQDCGWFSEEEILRLDPGEAVHLFALRGPPSVTISILDQGDGGHHMVCRADNGRIEMTPITGGRRRSHGGGNVLSWLKQNAARRL
jgi:hypothetical protein